MRVEYWLRRQAGVISREQALAAGLSRHAVDRRLATTSWRALLPRVYLAEGHPETDEVWLRAAALWAGRDAAVSGAAAAWWHGMRDAAPERITVTIPVRRCLPTRSGIVLRRRDLAPMDVVELRDVPITAVPLTALEAAVELGDDGSAFLDRALQRHVRFPTLHRAYCRNLGSRGSPAAGTLLAVAADRAGSAAERLLVRLLRQAAIAGWVLAYAAEGFVLDLAFPAARVAVEVDGWAWHVDVQRFRADRRRQNALVGAGWTVLRFTWHDLTTRPSGVISDIVAAIGRR